MRARAFSEWLRNHEPVVQLLFRFAMLALLVLALGQFRALEFTLQDINDQLSELRLELTNIRSDLEDGQDDATPTTLDIEMHESGRATGRSFSPAHTGPLPL